MACGGNLMTQGLVAALAFAPIPNAQAASAVALRSDVSVAQAELRVSDLVVIRHGTLPNQITEQVVARLPAGLSDLNLPSQTAAALLRRRVPGLRIVMPAAANVRVRVSIAPRGSLASGECFIATSAVQAGAALSDADVTATECRSGTRPATLRYDRAGLIINAADIKAGQYLGRLPRLSGRTIGKGATLTVRSAAGPVTVERTVTAMQAGRSGGRLFVRDGQGDIFAAPLVLAESR
jgi:flagella basal body P-ring formation protein FlgA